jgi:hypothetical protein
MSEFWVVRDVRGKGRAETAAVAVFESRSGR